MVGATTLSLPTAELTHAESVSKIKMNRKISPPLRIARVVHFNYASPVCHFWKIVVSICFITAHNSKKYPILI